MDVRGGGEGGGWGGRWGLGGNVRVGRDGCKGWEGM